MAWQPTDVLICFLIILCAINFLKRLLIIVYYTGGERLEGKVVIITGSNSGIGRQTALDFARRGAKVILACRNDAEGTEAEEFIRANSGNDKVHYRNIDLASFKSIRVFADRITQEESQIDSLVNNAGIFWVPYSKTEDGFESNFGVNHLGHFLLTLMVLPLLAKSSSSRIINLSSITHRWGNVDFSDINREKRPYSAFTAYFDSKYMNVLFTQELARRVKHTTNITCCSVDPGIVHTNIGRDSLFMGSALYRHLLGPILMPMLFKTAEQGAQTTIHCVLSPEVQLKDSGAFYAGCRQETPIVGNNAEEVAQRLWDFSLKLTGAKDTTLSLKKLQ